MGAADLFLEITNQRHVCVVAPCFHAVPHASDSVSFGYLVNVNFKKFIEVDTGVPGRHLGSDYNLTESAGTEIYSLARFHREVVACPAYGTVTVDFACVGGLLGVVHIKETVAVDDDATVGAAGVFVGPENTYAFVSVGGVYLLGSLTLLV